MLYFMKCILFCSGKAKRVVFYESAFYFAVVRQSVLYFMKVHFILQW